MRTFISYVDDNAESSEFADWLYRRLKHRTGLVPWLAKYDLPPTSTPERQLPLFVNLCDLFLLVRSKYVQASDACIDELHYARQYGKPVLVLNIAPDPEAYPPIDRLMRMDFTRRSPQNVDQLLTKARSLNTPLGEIAKLQDDLHRAQDGIRRRRGAARLRQEERAAELKERLKQKFAMTVSDIHGASSTKILETRRLDAEAGRSASRAMDLLHDLDTAESSVAIVVGPEGVGKTRLVEQFVAAKRERENTSVVYRRVSGPRSFRAQDLADIMDSFTNGSEPTTKLAGQPSVLLQLESKIRQLPDQEVLVIVDAGELLLDGPSGQLADPELNDALEIIFSAHVSPRFKVWLISREQPLVRHKKWFQDAARLHIPTSLGVEDFAVLLAGLDPDNSFGLKHPGQDLVQAIFTRTGGRPRAAEIIYGLLQSADVATSESGSLDSLESISTALASLTPDDSLNFLVSHLVGGLSTDERKILRALAAFRVAVDEQAVQYLTLSYDAKTIRRHIQRLIHIKLVRKNGDGNYYVGLSDTYRILEESRAVGDGEDSMRDLLSRAASFFALRRAVSVSVPSDLEPDFTEMELLLEAGQFDAAFRRVEAIDDVLANFGSRWLLLRHRQRLSGQIQVEGGEIINLQALGHICSHWDDLAQAESFYRQALSYAEGPDWVDYRQQLLVSLGTLLHRKRETVKAKSLFSVALAIAREFDQTSAQFAPLAGIADCLRHEGQIEKSVEILREALETVAAGADDQLGEVEARDRGREMGELNVKLGRRLCELGELEAAERALSVARGQVEHVRSWILESLVCDATADLYTRAGRIPEAVSQAQEAIRIASLIGRSPVVRQAWTTLCFCHLLSDDLDKAHRAAEEAVRNRPAAGGLLSVALLASVFR